MKAEILSIGTELLLGQIADTNAQWLAEQLPKLGIDLFYISQVGDNLGRIVENISRAWSRSDIIICSGGLGPTDDDLTREAISAFLGEPPEIQPDLEANLREYFNRRGLKMPEKNVKQATLIPSSEAVENPIGTAPGWWVQKDNHTIIAMPGVPHEMKYMWQNQIEPRLQPLLPASIIVSKTLKVLGKGESAVEEIVKDLITSTNPTTATYAKPGGIELRITAKAEDEMTARGMIFETELQARNLLGTLIFGEDTDTIEGVVGEMLQERNLTLGVIEAGTDGAISALLAVAPGSVNFFRGGLVTQQRAMLAGWGVDSGLMQSYGIVSREVVENMATAARRQTGSEAGLAVCVSPGPGAFEDVPAGQVFIAVDLDGDIKSSDFFFRTTIPELKHLSAVQALNILRRALLK